MQLKRVKFALPIKQQVVELNEPVYHMNKEIKITIYSSPNVLERVKQ